MNKFLKIGIVVSLGIAVAAHVWYQYIQPTL